MILSGGRDEAQWLRPLEESWVGPTHSPIGQLELGELGALIRSAALLVTGNTGPAHIAAAVGMPLVDLYALTNPQHTPWRVAHRLLFHDVSCRNCLRSSCPQGHHACLDSLSPRIVAESAVDLLAGAHQRPARTNDVTLAHQQGALRDVKTESLQRRGRMAETPLFADHLHLAADAAAGLFRGELALCRSVSHSRWRSRRRLRRISVRPPGRRWTALPTSTARTRPPSTSSSIR